MPIGYRILAYTTGTPNFQQAKTGLTSARPSATKGHREVCFLDTTTIKIVRYAQRATFLGLVFAMNRRGTQIALNLFTLGSFMEIGE